MANSRRGSAQWSDAFQISSALVGLIVLVTFVDWLLPADLRRWGILPRTARGLIGILFAPLLHLGYAHLFANALPLLVLLVLLFAERKYRPGPTLLLLWIGSGLGTWLIGRGNSVHIGASALIYGLVSYLIGASWWMRSWNSALVAIVVLVCYGGTFYGILPQRGMVSWEGHLAGALCGLLVAWWTHR